jgi:hypothetical protein
MFKELLNREPNILRYLVEQDWRDVSTGMERNRRNSAIGVPILSMGTSTSYHSETETLQNSTYFARFQYRVPGHDQTIETR